VVLEGERLRLRPMTDGDVPLLIQWFTDRDVLHWLHLSEDPPELAGSMEAHRECWERMRDDPTHLWWCTETTEGQPIGEIGLLAIHPTHHRAELAITIGVQEYRNRGYGAEAIGVLLRHAFETMGLRRVQLITDEDNARGTRCYEKCGFVREGQLRAHRLRYGKPLDMVVMAVLKEEWSRENRGVGRVSNPSLPTRIPDRGKNGDNGAHPVDRGSAGVLHWAAGAERVPGQRQR